MHLGVVSFFFGNSAQEWPKPLPKLRVQHRGTLFGAENTMNIEEQKVLAMADDILAFRILTKHLLSLFLVGSDLS
jgi:hypothetical protein